MSLLDKASLVVTPNGYKAGKLYSVIPNTALGDMAVVRATTATRVNSLYLIENVALNIPRIDYTNGSCPSILVEPQRTNLVFPSATLTTQTRTVTAAANTLSFYGTGTIVLSGVHIATLTGTGANNKVSLTFTPTAGSLILTVTGTVTNAQLELGSYPTSYIPTIASTATRNADVISKTGISSLIGQTEGTVFFDVKALANDNTTRIISFSDNTFNNFIRFSFASALNFATCSLISSGTTQASNDFSLIQTNNNKIAIKYKTNLFKIYVNGVLIHQDLTVNTFSGTTLDSLQFSNPLGGDRWYGNLKSIQLYKTVLTDTECINLTTL